MERAWNVLAELLLMTSLGCLGSAPDAGPAGEEGASQEPALDAGWGDQARIRVLAAWGEGAEADLACTFGGGPRLDRSDAHILPGTDRLEVNVTVQPPSTGVQIGYALDQSPSSSSADQEGITWLDPVRVGARTFQVPVAADEAETPDTGHLWAFYERMVLSGEEECYTGGGAGNWTVTIDAIRAPS